MIKVGKSPFEIKQMANNHFDLLDSVFNINHKIEVLLNDKQMKLWERKLFSALQRDIRKIIVGTPSDLNIIQQKITPLYQAYISKKTEGIWGNKKKAAIKKANEKIFTIFDYSEFIKKSDALYAYNFTENLNINVCVYCNRQYTFTLRELDGKCRPTLDHFFDKGKHPYFALSFYNLIPSCYTCNSSLKNKAKFTFENNLHPFLESMFEVLDFTIDISNVDFVDGGIKEFEISLKPSAVCTDFDLIRKAKANAEVFKLKELYSGHKDYAAEIIQKSYYYDRSKIDELFEFKTATGKSLFESRTEVIEFALGSFISEKKLGKRTLAKFTRDIAFDLGLEKVL